MFVVYALIAILAIVYLWIKKTYSFWENRGFPTVPGTFPIGSIKGMGNTIHSCELLKKFYDEKKEEGPAFGLYFMAQPVLIPTDPELVKDILVRHFDSFHDRGFYLNSKDDPTSEHLFGLKGQAWKDMRSKLSPTFTSGKIKMMYGTVSKVCDGMIDYLKPTADEGGMIEVKEVLASFTTEVISTVAFGLETKCLGNPTNDFRKMASAVFDTSVFDNLKFQFVQSYQGLSRLLGLTITKRKVIKFFVDVVKNSVKYREENDIKRNDFLQLLIQLKNSEAGMTLSEMVSNSFVFFLAGFETSSSVATFALYELAINQDIQVCLRKEIEEAVAKYGGEVTYESIQEMKYLDMVFNETIRKYPVVDIQFRQCTRDFKIPNSNLTIPEGAAVMLSSQALHHDERYWEEPDKFDPIRFTDENVKKRHPFSYIPFSEGPRICIGQRFGVMQTKLAIIKLLMNFNISACGKTNIPVKFAPTSVFQAPDGGMWLKLENRQK